MKVRMNEKEGRWVMPNHMIWAKTEETGGTYSSLLKGMVAGMVKMVGFETEKRRLIF